jgi:sugar phosphate isomerase/epimerase
MQLKVYKSLWGMTGSLEEQFERIKAAGYDGVESAAQETKDPAQLKKLLADHRFEYVALVYTEGPDHEEEFKRRVQEAMQYNPLKIVAHAGRDTMSYVKQIRFFVSGLKLEEEIGIPIAHETHRRRPFFSPMNTLAILRELPELHINADFSHWCCVTESMLEDHAEAIARTAERTVHLHGRVGYENGPQVPDPRVPEWEDRVKKHEAWWDQIIRQHNARNERTFTYVPEFGPPTYMQTIPESGKPASELWDVCLWAADRFRKQFATTAK